jgi:four helix bundle protein
MTYDDWVRKVPGEVKDDPVWNVEAYRLSLFLSDLAWTDMLRLLKDRRGRNIADQLFRASSGISANVEEGYSRSTCMDRARFFEFGLGSARESRGWYFKGRDCFGERVVEHRLQLTTQIVALLTAMTDRERRTGRRISRKSHE